MGSLQPRMRAGDADRQRVVEQLGKHFGEGRLTVAEFDERVARAHASVYLDELPALTVDLPREPDPRYDRHRPQGPQVWLPQAAVMILLAMVLASAVIMIVHGFVPIFLFVLLFLFLRHRRWSRRW